MLPEKIPALRQQRLKTGQGILIIEFPSFQILQQPVVADPDTLQI